MIKCWYALKLYDKWVPNKVTDALSDDYGNNLLLNHQVEMLPIWKLFFILKKAQFKNSIVDDCGAYWWYLIDRAQLN